LKGELRDWPTPGKTLGRRIPDHARAYIEARIFGPGGPAEVAEQLRQFIDGSRWGIAAIFVDHDGADWPGHDRTPQRVLLTLGSSTSIELEARLTAPATQDAWPDLT
jgi:hypothetical protein